jgi:Tol biopolymer transport system component
MKKLVRIGLVTAIALACAPVTARNFTPEDIIQLNRLGGSAVTADGGMLVFSLNETDLEANARHSDLWLLDLRETGSMPERWQTSGDANESAPIFSDDGSAVYYLSDSGGLNQVWRAPLGEGEAVQANAFERRCSKTIRCEKPVARHGLPC